MPSLTRRIADSLASVFRRRAQRRGPLLLEIDDISTYHRAPARRRATKAGASVEETAETADGAGGLLPCGA